MLPLPSFLPLSPIPSLIRCPPAEDRMTVRDIFYLLARRRTKREEDQMRGSLLLGAVGRERAGLADGRRTEKEGR